MMTEKKRVLVVDDEPHIVKLVKLSLGDKNYDIVGVTSGKEAISYVKDNTPDILVLDLMMPGVNGYEVCQSVRENPKTKGIPIIILSAKSQMLDKLNAIDVGADDYMCKPFDPDELARRIKLNLSMAT
jgi:DNA-binding response OmpR family regulator